ncbi:S-layer homology domain-containing protein [Citricoccus alkalitolerans]|uniref:Acyl-CoA:diacylglycerol acyltransferase n=1 Tax=Citricoccus alkalitolerans TaxID=246603 RepID=A0ABV8XXL7_9MICC
MIPPVHRSQAPTRRHTTSRQRVIVATTAAAALTVTPLAALPAVAASGPANPTAPLERPTAPGGTGLPNGVPDAALAPEPTLPKASGWDFSETFARTSGTGRYDDGAYLWTDWLYDDTGTGNFTYDDPESTGSNGADIFRAAIAADDSFTYWRIDWNTLIDPEVPIAAWTFDTDRDTTTGVEDWPAAAGASSPGIDTSLVVSSRGAWVTDLQSGEEIDVVSEGGQITVDADARSFVVAVPRDVLPADGSWTTRLASGLADSTGTAFAPAPQSGEGTRIYNASFRDMEDEPHLVGDYSSAATHWNNGRQSELLADGDLSDFALDLDWSAIDARESTAEAAPTGYSTRWFVSSVELAQGMDAEARKSPGPGLLPASFWGRVQPYTVYVPTTYSADEPAPLTILLHGGDSNHNAFLGSRKDELYGPMCEERGSICVSPLGRGLSTWYINHAELDVWEVWNRTAETFTLDSESTVVGGHSMGGVGSTRLLTNYPDVFAGAVIASGAGYYNAAGQRDREGAPGRVENLGHVNTFIDSGSEDIALANTRVWDAELEDAGVPYQANYYEGADHGAFGWLGWSDAARYLSGMTRTTDPADIVYRWEPGDDRPDLGLETDGAYWLTGLDPRDDSARWSRATATSGVLDTTEFAPVHTDTMQTIDGWTVNVREQQRVAQGDRAPRNEVDLNAENVATMAVDLDRAQLDRSAPGTVRVATDGETELTLARGEDTVTLGLDGGDHELTNPSEPDHVEAAAADGAVLLSWPASASPLPDVTYTVRNADGAAICTTSATMCTIEGLTNGEEYSFSVSAANVVGSSAGAVSPGVTPGAALVFSDNAPGSAFYAPVQWMATHGISTGYTDGTFRKGNDVTRAETTAFLHRYIKPDFTAPDTSPFDDLNPGSNHYEAITWAATEQITLGYQNGTFQPHRPVTRGEFATFLYRLATPEHNAPQTSPFDDLPTTNHHYEAITWLASQGITIGDTHGHFNAADPVTRGEISAFLQRYDNTQR